ncbi:hypothetical protein [Agromyces humi]|uniref:hypothetical protein n=1 Tax=Agromyces humi TaxID=1766800 RepID=UPI0013567516|nr:hypothetical protein [Agromyces humi]
MFDENDAALNDIKAENQWKWSLRNAVNQVAEIGRLPQADDVGYERLAGRWLAKQRDALRVGDLRPDREVLLDQQIPEWRQMSAQEQFEVELVAVAMFKSQEHRMPNGDSPDEHERSLAMWVIEKVKANRDGRLPRAWVDLLDEYLSGWDRGGASSDAMEMFKAMRNNPANRLATVGSY